MMVLPRLVYARYAQIFSKKSTMQTCFLGQPSCTFNEIAMVA